MAAVTDRTDRTDVMRRPAWLGRSMIAAATLRIRKIGRFDGFLVPIIPSSRVTFYHV